MLPSSMRLRMRVVRALRSARVSFHSNGCAMLSKQRPKVGFQPTLRDGMSRPLGASSVRPSWVHEKASFDQPNFSRNSQVEFSRAGPLKVCLTRGNAPASARDPDQSPAVRITRWPRSGYFRVPTWPMFAVRKSLPTAHPPAV